MASQQTLRVRTRGRGTTDLTAEVERVARASGVATGTWQGIYLWEHRQAPHARSVVVTVSGDN